MSGRAEVRAGDALEVLRTLPDCSVDALVTDPPAGIGFMGKEWDAHRGGRAQWVAWLAEVMREVHRVLKPGAHGFVWALPRTSHWTATALEEAGFEIRDRVAHLFGTGFPKSLDVSKAIDAAAGAKRKATAERSYAGGHIQRSAAPRFNGTKYAGGNEYCEPPQWMFTAPATPEAARWDGWGTALKPACEDWWLVRKPLEGTVAANVLRYGTGGLNVDGCRIETPDGQPAYEYKNGPRGNSFSVAAGPDGTRTEPTIGSASGRWPANVVLDPEAARALDEMSGELKNGGQNETSQSVDDGRAVYGAGLRKGTARAGDSGGASRFFYTAKADRSERDGGLELLEPHSAGEATDRKDGSAGLNSPRAGAGRTGGARNYHPTVKPVALMRWLCRLITPPGGLVLDPFCGSGTTGVACLHEGFRFLGLEREPDYVRLAAERLAAWTEVKEKLTTIEARAAGQLALFSGAAND